MASDAVIMLLIDALMFLALWKIFKNLNRTLPNTRCSSRV